MSILLITYLHLNIMELSLEAFEVLKTKPKIMANRPSTTASLVISTGSEADNLFSL